MSKLIGLVVVARIYCEDDYNEEVVYVLDKTEDRYLGIDINGQSVYFYTISKVLDKEKEKEFEKFLK